ncbi:MAG: serine hydrolase [Acidimicrobiia bacterium]|nr:serine hydrolase [Acidimicrobiia bacterium]
MKQAPLIALPPQPEATPYPGASWPTAELPKGVEIEALLNEMFDPESLFHETFGVVIVHKGEVVAQRYANRLPSFAGDGEEITNETPLLSWSLAKSMLHAVIGMIVSDGRLVPDAPAPVDAWSKPGDPRQSIRTADLLAMRDGLKWSEVYSVDAPSDVVAMLFGEGRDDVAGFAEKSPAEAPPNSRYAYSSGTSNILSAIASQAIAPETRIDEFLQSRLLDPIGMSSARATIDEAGTWVASTFVYATALDFARFGLLYLRDGVWRGKRILPEGWVDHARTPLSRDEANGHLYGNHWWVSEDRYGSFWAIGHEGQCILVCPALDLVLVRIGRTGDEGCALLPAWREAILDAFAAAD